MTKKIVFIIAALIIGLFAFMGFKIISLENNNNDLISLSTDPNPLRPGQANFTIDVKDKNGQPVDNAKISFDLNMVTMNMGVQNGDAIFQGNGKYLVVGRMSMRGPWLMGTKITMPDGSIENKDFSVNVP